MFNVGEKQYFAPLSSPKLKHKKIKRALDLIKIKDGDYGVVNLNNMIPVNETDYEMVDLNEIKKEERTRIILLQKQSRWLNNNRKQIISKARLLYKLYLDNKLPESIRKRCCDFLLLESVSLKWHPKKWNSKIFSLTLFID